ncbi:metal-dependent hydrolase [Halalkalibacter flavus]|jgi:inner membrane protein|uniref:metal-dependent hydrolase n=1 Tax=Halalkalibacter flavus TaxID=3090668 RepID=UPI002FCAF0F9
MKGTTHLIGGVTAAVIYENQFPGTINEPFLFYTTALAGAIIPDICHPKSMIGRRLPIVSRTISTVFGHRSFSHSLLFLMIVYLLTEQLTIQGANAIQLGLLLGVGSHIVLDAITPQGVKLFYPIKMNVRTPIYVKTGSVIGETVVTFCLGGLLVFYLFS